MSTLSIRIALFAALAVACQPSEVPAKAGIDASSAAGAAQNQGAIPAPPPATDQHAATADTNNLAASQKLASPNTQENTTLAANEASSSGTTAEAGSERSERSGAEPSSRAAKDDVIFERVKGFGCPEVPNPDIITEGQMRLEDSDGRILALPLAHTAVEADVSGFLAQVWVTQYFTNPFNHPIEAVYTFPLPRMAAVDDMEMLIGERVIKGQIKKKEEARQIYDDAKRAGKTASLLDQQRPNIFTQSVANIMPGDRIKVRIRYVEDLKYEDGRFEYSFPMVVGPRFIPGNSAGRTGTGWSNDTDRVPDASKITPPVLKPGQRSGHDIEVTLTIDAGNKIASLDSPSHELKRSVDSSGKTVITLAPFDTIPNKDLIVRYRTEGESIKLATLMHKVDSDGHFMLMFEPPSAPKAEEMYPRELVFVFDCSGSMYGSPLAASKNAVKKAMKAMRPTDSFQLIQFSDAARGFAARPVPNTPENLKRGLQWVDELREGGGTQMIEGIKASLDYPVDAGKIRIVAFLTDGFIGNDDEILAAIDRKIGNSRLFSFGIGSSVNRYLLDKMAEVGRGNVTYIRQDESPDQMVDRFFKQIDSPVLVDINLETTGNVKTKELFPTRIPDLFAGQPLLVHGKYEGSGAATFVVTGKQGDKDFRREINVTFPSSQPENSVLATLWARTRIEYLMTKLLRHHDNDIVAEVTELAIKYRLMSQYTSFVAVEESVRNKDGRIETVTQPVEMPEGVAYEGVFGGANQPAARVRTGGRPGMGYGGGGRGMMKAKREELADYAASPAEVVVTEAEPTSSSDRDDEKEESKVVKKGQGPVKLTVQLDGTLVLSGSVEESSVDKLAKGHLSAWRSLLQRLLAGEAHGSYLVNITFLVDEKGKVTLAEVSLDRVAPSVREAVKRELSTLAYKAMPASRAGKFKVRLAVTVSAQ